MIQRLIDDWIIKDTEAGSLGYFVAENGVSYVSFPNREFKEDGFYETINDYAPLLIVTGLIYSVSQGIRAIVSEKELKQKELMKMMSISDFSLELTWFLTIFSFFFVTGIICTILSSQLYEKSDGSLLFIFWEFIFLAVTMFIFLIASISTKATRAVLLGILTFFIGYFLSLVTNYDTGNGRTIAWLSLHPVTAMSYGLQVIGQLEDAGVGLTETTWNSTDNSSGYTFSDTLNRLVLNDMNLRYSVYIPSNSYILCVFINIPIQSSI